MDEFQKRDEALDKLEKARTDLLVYGRRVADALVRAQGTVTSIDVLAQLRREGYDVDAFDKRWIGAVFRRGWVRVGYEATGSHGRPVARWALKGSNNAA